MTDPAATVARAAAAHFASEYGPGLPAEVEAELAAGDRDGPRPGQYDAVVTAGLVMSAASLIVAIAQLAQSIWAVHHEQTPKPSPEAIARQTRIELRRVEIPLSDGTLRLTEFIATETTRQRPPAAHQD